MWLWRGDSLATRHSSLTTSSLRFSTDDEAQKRVGLEEAVDQNNGTNEASKVDHGAPDLRLPLLTAH